MRNIKIKEYYCSGVCILEGKAYELDSEGWGSLAKTRSQEGNCKQVQIEKRPGGGELWDPLNLAGVP